MKNLVIVYGPPRTASSFLVSALVQHKQCFGTDALKNEDSKELKTNENPFINIHGSSDDAETIDRLWQKHVPEGEKDCYLVLRAPGYCFAYPYFSNLKSYACKYIFVDRNPIEVADSMCNHEPSQSVLKRDLVGTDCPEKEKYNEFWLAAGRLVKIKHIEVDEEAALINRALLRYDWHIKGTPDEMMEKSLVLKPYSSRKNSEQVAKKIEKYLSIKPDEAMRKALGKFYHRSLSIKRKAEIKAFILPEIKEVMK